MRYTPGSEVFFLTSQQRLYDAYLKWYAKSNPGSPDNPELAAAQTRGLVRFLRVPTDKELEAYRKERNEND